jgi:hypothetical protein
MRAHEEQVSDAFSAGQALLQIGEAVEEHDALPIRVSEPGVLVLSSDMEDVTDWNEDPTDGGLQDQRKGGFHGVADELGLSGQMQLRDLLETDALQLGPMQP